MTKWLRLLMVAGSALILDACSKTAIEQNFHLYEQREVIGDYVRLTYMHNPGAAFGISVGPHSSVIFGVLSVIALAALMAMYATTPVRDGARLYAIGLIVGGALGNLWNRIVSRAGVVDWIDVGVGATRWPVFNLADIAVTTGAVVLAFSLWREETAAAGARNGDSTERRGT